MKYTVSVTLTDTGFNLHINKRIYPVSYPPDIWKSFPHENRLPYASFIAYMTTVHFTFQPSVYINYLFPAPFNEPLFFYGLILSQPENLIDFDNGLKTSDYLKFIFNSFFKTKFTGHQMQQNFFSSLYTPKKNTAVMPFTFGKDSLLTYGLCRDLGIDTTRIFCLENKKVNENNHRFNLINQFKREFGKDVLLFTVPLQKIKRTRGLWWGWDIFLTQYLFFLVPYMHYYKSEYFFWSDEYDRNIIFPDPEGFLVNPTFDQSGRWIQVMETGLRLFGCNIKVASLIDSLSELSVHAILHYRYPTLAKYQTSCNSDMPGSKKNRWCAKCLPCAEDYLYLSGLGINPGTVDFKDDLLKINKKRLFHIFKKINSRKFLLSNLDYLRNQHLYGFYLAYKKGVKGDLIDEFAEKYLSAAEKKSSEFKQTYFGLKPSITVPDELAQKISEIFQLELNKIKSTVLSQS